MEGREGSSTVQAVFSVQWSWVAGGCTGSGSTRWVSWSLAVPERLAERPAVISTTPTLQVSSPVRRCTLYHLVREGLCDPKSEGKIS